MISRIFNRETLLYLLFGVLTTLVNYLVFFSLGLLEVSAVAANAAAFAVSVIFAYVVNKCFVFESKSWAMPTLWREILSFFAARVFSFAIEEAGLFVCDNLLGLGQYEILSLFGLRLDGVGLSKILLSVIVVILNFFFCKWVTFRKK